ncbi:MAG: 50S ribosomal protein L13 [Anaerolineales bacterium]|nr:50S ribosomal protein L13 [Anaerolineales bacterium]
MFKTFVTKQADITHDWYVIDAAGQSLGRLASKVAAVLRGKHKPIFTPGMDTGDFVIVINAAQVTVTGNKLTEKFYYRYSGYPGGMTSISLRDQLAQHPDRVIEHAVWGMLPHNRLGRAMLKKLKVYGGADHPHAAQKPAELK